jgi:hypothetical protein
VGALQQVEQGSLDGAEFGLSQGLAGDQDQIPTGEQGGGLTLGRQVWPDGFTQ